MVGYMNIKFIYLMQYMCLTWYKICQYDFKNNGSLIICFEFIGLIY